MKPWIIVSLILLAANVYQYSKHRTDRTAQLESSRGAINNAAANAFTAGFKLGYIMRHKNATKEDCQTAINTFPDFTWVNNWLSTH